MKPPRSLTLLLLGLGSLAASASTNPPDTPEIHAAVALRLAAIEQPVTCMRKVMTPELQAAWFREIKQTLTPDLRDDLLGDFFSGAIILPGRDQQVGYYNPWCDGLLLTRWTTRGLEHILSFQWIAGETLRREKPREVTHVNRLLRGQRLLDLELLRLVKYSRAAWITQFAMPDDGSLPALQAEGDLAIIALRLVQRLQAFRDLRSGPDKRNRLLGGQLLKVMRLADPAPALRQLMPSQPDELIAILAAIPLERRQQLAPVFSSGNGSIRALAFIDPQRPRIVYTYHVNLESRPADIRLRLFDIGGKATLLKLPTR